MPLSKFIEIPVIWINDDMQERVDLFTVDVNMIYAFNPSRNNTDTDFFLKGHNGISMVCKMHYDDFKREFEKVKEIKVRPFVDQTIEI